MPARPPLFTLVAAAAVIASGLVTGGVASATTPTVDPAPNGYVPAAVVQGASPVHHGPESRANPYAALPYLLGAGMLAIQAVCFV